MTRELTWVHKYEKDVRLNPFGDYDYLRLDVRERAGGAIQQWSLTSSVGAPDVILGFDSARHALEQIFLQGAEKVLPKT